MTTLAQAPDLEPPDPEARVEPPQATGAVVIRRTYSPDRKEASVHVEFTGDIGILEVSDILRMALVKWTAQLGLSGRPGP